jgi:hypothetical protein
MDGPGGQVRAEVNAGAGSAPKPLIVTRFGLGCRDPAWFEHRLVLLSAVTAPSLLAQDDQFFDWAIFVDGGLPPAVRDALEHTLSPFQGRALLTERQYRSKDIMALAEDRGLVEPMGYVLTGGLDDDDAWERSTIRLVRGRVGSWLQDRSGTSGVGITFKDGLIWVMYDQVDFGHLRRTRQVLTRRGAVYPFTFDFNTTSGFLCSRLSDGVTPASTHHPKMTNLLTGRGFELATVSTDTPMWLYCRHKQSTSVFLPPEAGGKQNLTLADLAAMFGIDERRTAAYLSEATTFGYNLARNSPSLRLRVERELGRKEEEIEDLQPGAERAAQLRRERAELEEKLCRLRDQMIGELPRSSQ